MHWRLIKLLCFHAAAATVTDVYTQLYVCMGSSCAEWTIDAWTLPPYNNYLIQEGEGGNGLTQCECVCVSECVLNHGLLRSIREHEIPLHQRAINAEAV